MNREGFYMQKLNIEDIEKVAGGISEEDQELVDQARRDSEESAESKIEPWSNSKRYKGSMQSAMVKKILKDMKNK